MKSLTWHIEPVVDGSGKGPSYRLEADYEVSRVWAKLSKGAAGIVQFDINDDGTSIFSVSTAFSIPVGHTEDEQTHSLTLATLREDSVIPLDIDEASDLGAGASLTVQLDLIES